MPVRPRTRASPHYGHGPTSKIALAISMPGAFHAGKSDN